MSKNPSGTGSDIKSMSRNATNLVQVAFDAHENLMSAEENLVRVINPRAFDEPVDDILIAAVAQEVCDAADAVRFLVPRSRTARLNMRWKDFLAVQQARYQPPQTTR
jgi:hypothetical protein